MLTDRSVRSLSALDAASTSRVLNLLAIAKRSGDDPGYREHPLFMSPVLNASIILKHRVRTDESYLFSEPRIIATKIIVPFDPRDLRVGGRSCFVGQRGFEGALAKLGQCKTENMDRDRLVLRLIDRVPSLDPFLLREQLKMHGIAVSNCYFEISPADQARMHDFVSQHLGQLISLASGGTSSAHEPSTTKLVAALLSNETDEKLEPLRVTLMLNETEFREGVFSWRGFLFYKWSMTNFWPQVGAVLKELMLIQPAGRHTVDQMTYLQAARARILDAIRTAGRDMTRALQVYDQAYEGLVRSGQPKAFRDFLLGAPYMFVELGERVAGISHVTNFWRYRFPHGVLTGVDTDELCGIFQDFESGFLPAEPTALAVAV